MPPGPVRPGDRDREPAVEARRKCRRSRRSRPRPNWSRAQSRIEIDRRRESAASRANPRRSPAIFGPPQLIFLTKRRRPRSSLDHEPGDRRIMDAVDEIDAQAAARDLDARGRSGRRACSARPARRCRRFSARPSPWTNTSKTRAPFRSNSVFAELQGHGVRRRPGRAGGSRRPGRGRPGRRPSSPRSRQAVFVGRGCTHWPLIGPTRSAKFMGMVFQLWSQAAWARAADVGREDPRPPVDADQPVAAVSQGVDGVAPHPADPELGRGEGGIVLEPGDGPFGPAGDAGEARSRPGPCPLPG